jgi:hypothetical protein
LGSKKEFNEAKKYMNKRKLILWVTAGILAAVLGTAYWFFYWKPAGTKPELSQTANESPLYDPRDKPMTVILKTVGETSGRLEGYKWEIRQSKSRYNQMKQALMAFLKGPPGGTGPAWGGLTLNEFYFAPQGLAVMDVSTAQLQPSQFGHYEEALFVKGLIESLSGNFFEIKAVKLLVDGQEAPTVAGHYALGTADVGAPLKVAPEKEPEE